MDSIGDIYTSLSDKDRAIDYHQRAIQLADEVSSPMVQINARLGLSQDYLYSNDLVNALSIIEIAVKYDVLQNNYNASARHGIIVLQQGDEVAAQGAFLRAIGQADEILSKTAEYYSALDAKGLAICDGRGAALLRPRRKWSSPCCGCSISWLGATLKKY